MKKLLTLLFLMALSLPVLAQDAITPTTQGYFTFVEYDWTSDASGDAVGRSTLKVPGIIFAVTTAPDGTAVPTTLYDVTIQQAFQGTDDSWTTIGTDYASSVALNRSAVAIETEDVWPVAYSQINGYPVITIANAGNAKEGTVTLIIYRTLQFDGSIGQGNLPSGGAGTQMLQWLSNGQAKWVTMSGDATIADGGAVSVATLDELHLADNKGIYFGDSDDFEFNYDSATLALQQEGSGDFIFNSLLVTMAADLTVTGDILADTVTATTTLTMPAGTVDTAELAADAVDGTILDETATYVVDTLTVSTGLTIPAGSIDTAELATDAVDGTILDETATYTVDTLTVSTALNMPAGTVDTAELATDAVDATILDEAGTYAMVDLNLTGDLDVGGNDITAAGDLLIFPVGTDVNIRNSVNLGDDDSTVGRVHVYGGSGGTGGDITIYEGATADTQTGAWAINNDATEDLVIASEGGTSAGTALTIDGTTLDVTVGTDLVVTTDFTLNGMLFDQTLLADNYIWVYNLASGNFELEAQSGGGGADLDLDDDEYILFGDADEIQEGYDGTAAYLEWNDSAANQMMRLVDGGTTGNLFLTGDLSVDGGDIVTGSGNLTIAPAGGTLDVTGLVTASTGAALGAADSAQGSLYAYSNASTSGGRLILYEGPDNDAQTNHWAFNSETTENLVIASAGGTSAGDALTINGTTLAVTIADDLVVTGGSATIGTADVERGALVLGSQTTGYGGYFRIYQGGDDDSTYDYYQINAWNDGDFQIHGGGTKLFEIVDTTNQLNLTGDVSVDGGDIVTASGDLTIAPAGSDTYITGDLYTSALKATGDLTITPAGLDTNVSSRLNLSGLLDIGDGATLTISGTTFTVTDSFHLISGDGNVTCNTIAGGTRAGQVVILGMSSSTGYVQFEDKVGGSGTNIYCTNSSPYYIELSDQGDTIAFVYDGSDWRSFGQEPNND